MGATYCFSQNDNPFKEFGYDVMVAGSSKGEYEEFHDQTDIVEIGSVLFNTKTNQIVRILNKDGTTIDVSSATAAMSIDPLCEKYYWISPYVYCANNPIKFIDPDGKEVVATDMLARRNIVNTLTKKEAQYVQFNDEGRLNTVLLNTYDGSSDNFAALHALANSETNYIFIVANQDINGSEFFEKGSKPDNPDNFYYGITNMPGVENNPSPNSNVYIFTAPFLDEKTQARNTAHEGYGHAYFFELSKSNSSINPNHTKGPVGTGVEYDSNVPYTIFGNNNTALENQIKKVEELAIKNYESKNP